MHQNADNDSDNINQLQQLLLEKEKEITSLKKENATLQNVIAHLPGNIFWMDETGNILGINKNNALIFGYASPEEVLGKNLNELIGNSLTNKLNLINQEVFATGQELYLEEHGFDIHKNPAIYLTQKTPLFDETGNATMILGVAFDITDRKRMEEELKIAKEKAETANDAKSQFLAVVNHELSTPLAGIIGLIQILKQDNLPLHEKEKIITSVENCTYYLLSLVNDILDFSRIEKGKYNLSLTYVNIMTIIDEIYDIMNVVAENKKIELQIKIIKPITKTILTDARILRQILMNLVSNAIKFTEKGSVTLEINADDHLHTTQLQIAIIDTGPGIPENKLTFIFEPFQQLEDAHTRQSSRRGTGLGLTIVKSFSNLLSTEIKVKSTLGQGSRFSIIGEFKTGSDIIPIAHTSTLKTRQIHKENIPLSEKKLKKKPHVLLVEDDAIIQYVHQNTLSDLGCDVDVAANGLEAMKLLANHNIVFVDLSLPDISGFEVIRRIRKINQTIPIIALTVYKGKEEKQASFKDGANEFVNKPISKEELFEILLRYF